MPCQLESLRERMKSTEEGKLVLATRPNIHSDDIDLESLAQLDENQFGRQYYDMLKKYSISPDTRVPVKFIEGEDNAFIMKRFRQCHDLLHLLLDAPTNFEGESFVKAYEFHQTGLLVPLVGFTAAPASSVLLYRLSCFRAS